MLEKSGEGCTVFPYFGCSLKFCSISLYIYYFIKMARLGRLDRMRLSSGNFNRTRLSNLYRISIAPYGS